LIVVSLLMGAAPTAYGQSGAYNKTTVIGGVVKSEPSQTTGEKITGLNRGDTVQVIEGTAGFLRVMHDGEEGWLSKRMVTDSLQNLEFEGNRKPLPDLIESKAELRTRPVGGEVIEQLSRGDTVQVTGRRKFSFQAVYNGREGWIPRREVMRPEQLRRYGSQSDSPSDTVIAMAGVLREEPDQRPSEVVDSLSYGDTLEVFGRVEVGVGTVVKVRHQGNRGWVSENMVMSKEEAKNVRSEERTEEAQGSVSSTTDTTDFSGAFAVLLSILAWGLLSVGVGVLARKREANPILWTFVALLISPVLGFVLLVASTAGVGQE
jgi:hypothetical protein